MEALYREESVETSILLYVSSWTSVEKDTWKIIARICAADKGNNVNVLQEPRQCLDCPRIADPRTIKALPRLE